MELEPFINTLSVGEVTTITQVKALPRNKGVFPANLPPVDTEDPAGWPIKTLAWYSYIHISADYWYFAIIYKYLFTQIDL